MTPFHDNSTAPPSTATGEQRPLLQVSSTVVVNNDNNPTSIPISVSSSTAPRSTKKWWSFLAAAATLLLVCVARLRGGGVPTVHDAHRVRGNPGSTTTSGSRSSEMSAVHDSYLVRGNPFGTCLNGTVCGPDMSCDYSGQFCYDDGTEGDPCGYDGNGIACAAGYFCHQSTEYFFYMCTLTGHCAANYGSTEPCCDQEFSPEPVPPNYQCPHSEPTCVNYVQNEHLGTCDVCVCEPGMSCDYSRVCRDDATEGEACGRDGNGIECVAGYECNPYNEDNAYMCTSKGLCAANYGSTEPCCDQDGWEGSPDAVPPQYQCPQLEPTCVNYVQNDHLGKCV